MLPLLGVGTVAADNGVDELLSEQAFLDELPIVLSAARLPQSLADAPISTTIIDRQMIVASGFTEIPDLLRLAPGFIVDYDNGNTQAVGYHLLTDRFSRQMQVLVDGRSVYEPALGGVAWVELPLTIDDIERIEVVRGPNAASYGSNSFTAVINIITRHAVLDRGLMLKTNLGSDGLREGFMRYGGHHRRLDYRVTAAYREDDGFDGRHDFKEVRLITLRGDYEIDLDDTLMVQLGHNSGPKGEDNVFDALIPDHNKQTYSQFQQLRWTHTLSAEEEFYLQFYHNQNKDIDDYYTAPIAALGGTQVFIDERLTADRYDIEFQNILKPARPLRLVWGVGVRRDEVNGPLFFSTDKTIHNDSWRLFSNVEYHLTDSTLLNAGVMYEDSDTGGSHLSPRASINHHILPNHTLRLSVSRAYRDPFLFEQSPDYRFPVPVANNVLFFDAGDPDAERITSYEIGYVGKFPRIHTSLDAKYFYDDLDDLIAYDRTDFPLGVDGTAQFFDNFNHARIKGLELSAQYRPGNGSRLNINYTHQDINGTDRTDTVRYEDAGPSDILSMLAARDFGGGYSASVGFYYLSDLKELATNDVRSDQKRTDIRLARRLSAAGQELTFAFVVQNLFDDEQDTRLRNTIDRRVYGSVAVSFK
jgi:iron complex outermembrane receptor protein